MRLTRCSPLQLSSVASSCAGLVRGHNRLSVHRQSSPSFRRSTVGDGAERTTGPPHPELLQGSSVARPQVKYTTAADHVGVQAFLQDTLGISETAALNLISRGSYNASSFLRLANCQAWVAYLTQLAGGHTATVMAILHQRPHLLGGLFDEHRLDQLQGQLHQTLSIKQPQLLLMVKRRPELLLALADTVAAAMHFLLSHASGDIAAVRRAVVGYPRLLTCSVRGLQATLQWLTGMLGATPAAAMRMLPQLASISIDSTLEPGREWFLRQGLSPAQVLSLAQAAPPLLYLDMDGRLAQLKLQYWQHQLGYSLGDLTLVPVFLTCSLARIAGRHSALRHLQEAMPSHSRLLAALIAGDGSAPNNVGPLFYAAFVKQNSIGSGSVQEVLLPLAADLSQQALQAEWEAELLSHPCLEAAGTSARKHSVLYAALHSIQQRDWVLSGAGRGWSAEEAAAKAADLASRAAGRAVARSAKPPRIRRAPRNSSAAASDEDAL